MDFELNKNVIFEIVSTEKSVALRDSNRTLVLIVSKDASKDLIKTESEKAFGVVVDSVNVVSFMRLGRMFRGRKGATKTYKKAYVKISASSNFDFSKLQK